METDNLIALSALAEKLATTRDFNMLKPYPRRQGMHTANLYFRGYNDLNLTVMDIMKVCVSALSAMEDHDSDKNFASTLTIAEVLGLALNLMPMEEAQILDQCYELHLKLKAKSNDNNDEG